MNIIQWLLLLVLPLPAAYGLDRWIGDPVWLYHPVRMIGNVITFLERCLRRVFPATPAGERRAGVVLAAVVPILSMGAVLVCWIFAARIHVWVWFAVETWGCYRMLAVHSLRAESMAVYDCLAAQDLSAARRMVGRIVGRDTDCLEEAEIVRATVETIAENTSDGIVAPMLFMALGGAPLCYCYKAVNTLDSMVGYKNTRYLHFGRASARLDDAVNYLPARISAQMMITAAKQIQLDSAAAKRIYQRDYHCHPSPNSAHTEAVCAGALGIQLGGDSVYLGKTVHKSTIGDPIRAAEKEDIVRANRLMETTAQLALAACCVFRLALGIVLCAVV